MTLTFSARLAGREIHCEIGADTALSAPIFCFSLMAAATVVSGGILVRAVAGYAEVALPDLKPGEPHLVVIAHADPAYAPRNRAWLPLGGYLRVGDQCLSLPELPAGVIAEERPRTEIPADLLRLVPPPTRWRPNGRRMVFAALSGTSPALAAADRLAIRLGLPPILDAGGTPLDLQLDAGLPEEAYRLSWTADGITLAAAGDHGIFNAAVTLILLRQTYDGDLPCGAIDDAPRFGYRGQHLDCARHFFAVPTILRLLDLMALMKLNRFHWHFADDEAFRLEVDCAPDLWRQTAFRGEGCAVPGVFGGGIRAGGSYSKADVAAILARATELHIEVIPEIEVPAHSFAMIKAVPGLRDPVDNGAEVSVQGYADNVVNPALPAVWALLEPLSLEVARMFPIGMLHLGCDELPPGAWDGSAAIRALKDEFGLADRDDVQGWMMARLAGFLAANAIRPAAWEEAAKGANGGIGHNALLYSWTGQGPGIEAARRGYDVVMCPAQNTYFDMAHSADPHDWGATWAAFIALEQTVAWQPIPPGAEDVADRILGVEGCFWSEFTTADWQMEAMLAPRILGLACKAWDKTDRTDGATLQALASACAPLFDRIGWRRNRGA